MGKLLLFMLAAAAVYLLFRRSAPAAPPTFPHRSDKGEDMVRCATCGVHLPRSESMMVRGEFYCCEGHLPVSGK